MVEAHPVGLRLPRSAGATLAAVVAYEHRPTPRAVYLSALSPERTICQPARARVRRVRRADSKISGPTARPGVGARHGVHRRSAPARVRPGARISAMLRSTEGRIDWKLPAVAWRVARKVAHDHLAVSRAFSMKRRFVFPLAITARSGVSIVASPLAGSTGTPSARALPYRRGNRSQPARHRRTAPRLPSRRILRLLGIRRRDAADAERRAQRRCFPARPGW